MKNVESKIFFFDINKKNGAFDDNDNIRIFIL